MRIKDHYETTFNAIAQEYGEEPSTAQISSHDSLSKVIGYTREFVVEQGQDYRDNYYCDALSGAFQQMGFNPTGREVVHLDVGCGPGVFSWGLHDHMASRNAPDSVVYYGYDHCANMINLAYRFLYDFPEQYDFRGECDLPQIRKDLMGQNFADYNVVVTFGYALVQVQGDPAALEEFAVLIRCLFPSRLCIVVAADAHSGQRREVFGQQCTALEGALHNSDVVLEDSCVLPDWRSIMFARLNME